MRDDARIPEFGRRIAELEKAAWPHGELGERAPACWRAAWLGTEDLYKYATCDERCPGGDHTFRYLIGRCTNLVAASMRSAESGWYDTALVVARLLFEHANLYALLAIDPEALRVYKGTDANRHRDVLAPKKVNARLRERDLETPWSARHSDHLSVRMIHPPFDALIAAHTPGRVVVGPIFQQAGFLLALNELATAVLTLLLRIGQVGPDLSGDDKRALLKRGQELAGHLGGVTIDNLPPGLAVAVPPDRWM